MHLGISTGGHYLSEDGGETFKAANKGVGAGFAPDPYPEFGQCVHKIVRHDARPAGSTCRTTAAGRSGPGLADRGPTSACCAATTTATRGARSPRDCPRTSDFPIVVHPHDPDTVYVMPLDADDAHVSRRRSGRVAQRERRRLMEPARDAGCRRRQSYFTVLRDAMDIDELKTPALYFGTTTGQLWIGRDGGEKWECLFDSLPPIHSVKVAVV